MAIQETAVIEHVQDILTTLIIERVVLQETKVTRGLPDLIQCRRRSCKD